MQKNNHSFCMTLRYAMVQGTFWMSFNAIFGFASVYLLSKDFTNSQIGITFAIAGVISSLLQPLAGDFVDRAKKPRLHATISFFIICILLCAGSLITGKKQFLVIAILYGTMIAFLQVLTPLINSIGMHYINKGIRINFGIARGMGSLLYAVASFVIGRLADVYTTNVIIFATILINIMLFLSVFMFQPKTVQIKAENNKKVQEKSIHKSFAKTYPRFMVLLVGITFLFTSHNILNNYIFQIVQYHGAGSTEMGRVGALSAILELPTMFLFFYFHKKISAGNLIKISGLFFTIKAFLTFSATSMGMIYIAQFAQGLGFALFVVASVFYVNQKIEESDKVKGQAYMTVTNTAGSVFGSLLGGWLIDTINIPATLLIATLAGLIGTIIVLFSSDGKR